MQQTIYMRKYKRIAPWIIFAALLTWIVFAESPYQKGGSGRTLVLAIGFFIMLIAILIAISYDTFNLSERLIVAIILAIIIGYIVSVIIIPIIIDHFYSDKTWFLWETKHRLFINTVYYGLNAILQICLIHLYFKLRQQNILKK